MNAQVTSRYAVSYPAIAEHLMGQHLPWLQVQRQTALAKFASTGFPSVREEEWRYTNVSALEKKAYQPLVQAVASEDIEALLASQRLPDVWSVVLVNGQFSATHSHLDGLPAGVIISCFADALTQHPDWVQTHLAKAVSIDEHNFVAFNTAWFSDGVVMHIPAKLILSQPLQIVHLVTVAEGMATTRNLVVLDSQAEATIIETFAGADCAYVTNAITEITLGENAALTHVKLQAEAQQAYHFGGLYVNQAAHARFTQHNFAFGGLVARTDVHTDLAQAAECELNGLYSGIGRQHLDNHTRIQHLEPYACSRECYKGILDGRARGVFQGRVVVAEQAQKTDSQMHNRNLLLSNDAEADTKPQLEIYADDVKCTHGVTVGQLEEKSIFYLQSRGVDAESARNMLTFAFANEMVAKISLSSLHALVLELLLQRFPQADVQKDWL